jgi:serine/threonine protein phosphatase PrpC
MQDHSLVTLLVKYGIISPEEMDNSPARYTLLRALGEEELKDNEEEGKRGKIQTRA